jgi:hypothetical protein
MLDFITVLERCEQIGISFLGGKIRSPRQEKTIHAMKAS